MPLLPRFTLTLSDSARESLDQKKENGWSMANTVNTLVDTFAILPDDVNRDLTAFAKGKALEISQKMERSGFFAHDTMEASLNKYLAIIKYLNNGVPVTLDAIRTELDMQKVTIKGGHLICPKDFVLINPEEAAKLEAACVVECRNAAKYAIPHYIVFCNPKEAHETTESYDARILDRLLMRIPKFKRIVDLQVAPIYDPEHPEEILNAREFMDAPTIGYFPVYVHGNPAKPADYKPPYGVQIIKNQ